MKQKTDLESNYGLLWLFSIIAVMSIILIACRVEDIWNNMPKSNVSDEKQTRCIDKLSTWKDEGINKSDIYYLLNFTNCSYDMMNESDRSDKYYGKIK